MATKAETATAITHLLRGYPHCEIPEDSIEAYVEDLEDLDAAILFKAAKSLRKTSKFFPSIAEIRERCVELNPAPSRPEHCLFLPERIPEYDMPEETRKALVELRQKLKMPWAGVFGCRNGRTPE